MAANLNWQRQSLSQRGSVQGVQTGTGMLSLNSTFAINNGDTSKLGFGLTGVQFYLHKKKLCTGKRNSDVVAD